MFQVVDHKNNDESVDEFNTFSSAERAIDEYEKEDRTNGEFQMNRYEVAESNGTY